MREPNPRTSRLAIAAGIVVAVGLAGMGFIAGRTSAPTPLAAAVEPAPTQPALPATSPVASAALGRGELLTLAAQAADAFASNGPVPATVTAAAGRRFDLVLPFGCEMPGASQSNGPMRWSFDLEAGKLDVTVDPVIWEAGQWHASADANDDTELRGFWIARPWSSATTCSPYKAPHPDNADTPAPSVPTIGIARPTAPEVRGKVRSYEAVVKAGADDFSPEQGFQLRITGRTRSMSEGGPVTCLQRGGPDQRPICLIFGTFAEVRIENPKDGSALASWPIGDDLRRDDRSETELPRPG